MELEVEGGGGRELREKTEERCWEVGGGGSSCMDLSSSSCLRNCLFSPLRAFNWREKERDICTEEDKDNNNIFDRTASHATMKQTGESESLGESFKEVSTSHSFSEINQIKKAII